MKVHWRERLDSVINSVEDETGGAGGPVNIPRL